MTNDRLLITCEHGGNQVPEEYAPLFAGRGDVLGSHRGYDPGSLELAEAFAARFEVPLFSSTVTRLLVELNRSHRHRSLFSEFTLPLDPSGRETLLARHYRPYRERVENWIAGETTAGRRVWHVSVHSFAPVLNGMARTADVGLLYDPARPLERVLCQAWQNALRRRRPELRVRRNYPYLGKTDGFTTCLRRRFGPQCYAGIELEINQHWPQSVPGDWPGLQHDVIEAFAAAHAYR